jgi:hypothetical protein
MLADGDRCASPGGAGIEPAFSLDNEGFSWLVMGSRKGTVGEGKDFRKPMLYPLSYEG